MGDVFYLPAEVMSAFKILLDGSVLHKVDGKAFPGIHCGFEMIGVAQNVPVRKLLKVTRANASTRDRIIHVLISGKICFDVPFLNHWDQGYAGDKCDLPIHLKDLLELEWQFKGQPNSTGWDAWLKKTAPPEAPAAVVTVTPAPDDKLENLQDRVLTLENQIQTQKCVVQNLRERLGGDQPVFPVQLEEKIAALEEKVEYIRENVSHAKPMFAVPAPVRGPPPGCVFFMPDEMLECIKVLLDGTVLDVNNKRIRGLTAEFVYPTSTRRYIRFQHERGDEVWNGKPVFKAGYRHPDTGTVHYRIKDQEILIRATAVEVLTLCDRNGTVLCVKSQVPLHLRIDNEASATEAEFSTMVSVNSNSNPNHN